MPDDPGTLTAAAQALDAELARYEGLVADLRSARLDSEKGLRRASQALQQIDACDAQLAGLVQALVAAVTAAGTRQQTLAGEVRTCADRIRERSEVLQRLLTDWERLGADAAEVNRLVQDVAGAGDTETNGAERDGRLRAVTDRLGRLAEVAAGLAAQANGATFADLGRQAEALRLQLLNARNKLGLLLTREE